MGTSEIVVVSIIALGGSIEGIEYESTRHYHMRLQAPPRSPSLASSLPMAREQEFDTDTCGVTLEDSNHLRDDLRWPHRSH
jgi:hypothetical protein